MRRPSALLSLLAVLLVGLALGARFGAGALAQEGTPPPEEEEFDLPEGVTFEFVGFGAAAELPSPAELGLFRFRLEPGAVFDFDDADPGVALAVVEDGEITVAVEAEMSVLRAPGAGTPFPVEQETFAAGEEFEMAAGDSAVFPALTAGELRNDGDEEAVVLVSEVFPAEGEDGEAAGTPGAADAGGGAAVEIADFAFSPEELTVDAGTAVTWTNADGPPHTATADDGSFDSGRLEPGDSYSETFDEPGTYAYHCEIHPRMTGTIVVE